MWQTAVLEADSSSVNQEILRLSWNLLIQYHEDYSLAGCDAVHVSEGLTVSIFRVENK
jgi:hypothetical protein